MSTNPDQPTYNPGGLWTIWNINQIYLGTLGANLYVPKENDYVIDPPSGTLYIVSSLDLDNYIPTLQQIDIARLPTILQHPNRIINPNIINSVTSYKVYFNSTTSPYTMNVDSSLIVYNTLASTAKFFFGTDVVVAPQSIAVNIDNLGNITSDSVPLISLSYDNSSNAYMKAIPTAYTNQLLQNGDVVTILIYNAAGQVVSKESLIVENSTGYVNQSTPVLLVTGLSLESPFISTTQPNVISLPSNVGISSLELTGVVAYNNGTTATHTVNMGGPFNVYGLDQVLKANILGTVPIVLQYTLQPNEAAIVNQSYNSKTVSNQYTLELVAPNYDYQFQLYPIPFYNGSQFSIKWLLLSMSRNLFLDVTTLVTFSNGTGFNGASYNTLQSLVVSLNLGSINTQLNGLTLTQSCELNLSNVPTGPSTIYLINTNSALSTVPYGPNIRAKSLNSNNTILDITCQNYRIDTWLQHLYYANLPVTNSQIESAPPIPTNFDIIYNTEALATDQLITNSTYQRYQIDQWNGNITLNTLSAIPLNSTILIRFLLIEGNTTAVLGVSPLLITKY